MAAGQFYGTLGANEIIYTMTLDGEEGLKCPEIPEECTGFG